MIPNTACYWLKNVRVPVCVLTDVDRAIANSANMEGMALVDIKIVSEIINQIVVTGSVELENIPTVDLHGKQIWPCFVDVHTHLDRPFQDWLSSVTKTPADFMGLVDTGRIGVGMVADFIIFQGRYLSEILSRCQSDRIVIRNGKILEEKLPDYSELDPLIFDNF